MRIITTMSNQKKLKEIVALTIHKLLGEHIGYKIEAMPNIEE